MTKKSERRANPATGAARDRAKAAAGAPRTHAKAAPPRRAATAPAPAPPLPLAHPAFIAAALVAFACVMVSITFQLWDTDFWQHLVVGREIWRLHHVPNVELWTWPTYGAYDVTVSWGFRALLWPFWSLGGIPGLFCFRWLTTLAAFALLWAAARRMGARGLIVLPMIAWAALIYRQRTQLRPEMLVAVLLALQLWIHERRRAEARDGARAGASDGAANTDARNATLALPLIALAWANVHISYWLGLTLQAIYWLEAWWTSRGRGGSTATLRRLALIGLASGAISFINPAGWRALWQPFEYFLYWRHEPLFQMITELGAVQWQVNVRNGLALWVAGWPLLALWRWRRRGVDVAELLLCPLLIAMALGAQRFVGFLALAGLPFFARDLDDAVRALRLPAWTTPAWTRAALAALACVALSLGEWRAPQMHFGVGARSEWYPIAACDFMQAHGVRGRGFNHFFLGGYLLWRFYPQHDRLPFMDIHQAGTREDRRLYSYATTRPDAWAELDRKYRFDWVLINRYRVEADRSLDILEADSTFALVFHDDNAALYVRRAGPMKAVADSFAYHLMFAGSARGREHQGAPPDSAGRALLAREIARNLAESPWHATGLSVEANQLLLAGRWSEARDTLRASLAIDPLMPFAALWLSGAALAIGHPREAMEWATYEERHHRRTDLADEMRSRAHVALVELTARRAEVAQAAAAPGASPALRDTLAALDARLAPAPPVVAAKLPPCR